MYHVILFMYDMKLDHTDLRQAKPYQHLLYHGNFTESCHTIQCRPDQTMPAHKRNIRAKQGNMDRESRFGIWRYCPGCWTPMGGPPHRTRGAFRGEKKVTVILKISFIVLSTCPNLIFKLTGSRNHQTKMN